MSSTQKIVTTNTVWHQATVTRARREEMNGHRGSLSGLPVCLVLANRPWHMPWKRCCISAAAVHLCWMATI